MFWVMNAWPLPQTFWTGEGSPWLHCAWHVQVLSHHLPHSWLLAQLPLLTLSRRKISQHNTQGAKPAKLEHRAQEPAAQGRSRRATACRALPKCGRNLAKPATILKPGPAFPTKGICGSTSKTLGFCRPERRQQTTSQQPPNATPALCYLLGFGPFIPARRRLWWAKGLWWMGNHPKRHGQSCSLFVAHVSPSTHPVREWFSHPAYTSFCCWHLKNPFHDAKFKPMLVAMGVPSCTRAETKSLKSAPGQKLRTPAHIDTSQD